MTRANFLRVVPLSLCVAASCALAGEVMTLRPPRQPPQFGGESVSLQPAYHYMRMTNSTGTVIYASGERIINWEAVKIRQLTNDYGGNLVGVSTNDLFQAAREGHGPAQVWLAKFYYQGSHGLATNRLEAYQWASIAARQGLEAGKWLADEIAVFLNAPERETAQAVAARFQPQKRVLTDPPRTN